MLLSQLFMQFHVICQIQDLDSLDRSQKNEIWCHLLMSPVQFYHLSQMALSYIYKIETFLGLLPKHLL